MRRIPLALSVLLAITIVILQGVGGSDTETSPYQYGLALPAALYILFVIYLRKRISFSLSILLSIVVLAYGLVAFTSLSCGRCVPVDARAHVGMHELHDALQKEHDATGSYPQDIETLKTQALAPAQLMGTTYQYKKIDNSYSLCSPVGQKTWYGYPLGRPSLECIDPDGTFHRFYSL
jgi:hypothetical protein